MRVIGILLLLVCTACGGRAPASPTVVQTTITVRVLSYSDQMSPVPFAQVTVDDGSPIAVDSSGVAVVTVPVDVDVTIEASADGYTSMSAVGAADVPGNWTFWLEKS